MSCNYLTKVKKDVYCLAQYFTELSLVDYNLAATRASVRAAAASALAIRVLLGLSGQDGEESLHDATGLTKSLLCSLDPDLRGAPLDGAVACCEADGAVGGSGAHQQNFAYGLQKVQRREVPLRREVAPAGLCRVVKDNF